MFELVKKLTELPGPVGLEETVQNVVFENFHKHTDEVKITNIGNVVAHFPGKGKKILINAHADEIGYTVQNITEEGFIKISPGEPRSSTRARDPYLTIGQKALIIGSMNNLRGVFATAVGHVLQIPEREKTLSIWDVFIDVGASSKKEVIDAGVNVGSSVIWNPVTEKYGKKISGKAMDDRVGLAAMIKLGERLAEKDVNYDVYFASTVQEEVGLIGASALAFEDAFDIALSIDIGLAGDIPNVEFDWMPIELGKGPVIVHKDGRMHYDRHIINELVKNAEKNNIAIQHGVFPYYASDCASLVAGNARPVLIAPPARYTHSPFETVHEDDLLNLVELLDHYLIA
jgi:endoglucanase